MRDRPFAAGTTLAVVLPTDHRGLDPKSVERLTSLPGLLEANRAALECELGCRFSLADPPPSAAPRWLIGPYECNPAIAAAGASRPDGPQISLDRQRRLLITDGDSVDQVIESFSYLRSLDARFAGRWKIDHCTTLDAAVERICREVGNSYPSFALKNKDWRAICQHHKVQVMAAPDPVPAIQEWLAELDDSHTGLHADPPMGTLPYDLIVRDARPYFYRVAKGSAAWARGIRPGCELLGEDIEHWARRTGASAHSKPYVIGARMLARPLTSERACAARTPAGDIVEWSENPRSTRWTGPPVSWRWLRSGIGYLRIEAWLPACGLEDQVDAAFAALRSAPGLVVDLRANPGGALRVAEDFRSRFLADERAVGWTRSTDPDGHLGPWVPINGQPAAPARRWSKPVVFLTDPLSYSATEDALLGLRRLDQVQIMGQRSGGGSGRVRSLRLLDGWRLTVSTALSYDHDRSCIEGQGLPVDQILPFSFDENQAIRIAEAALS